ncbi:hypothetical protein CC86DRAFT_388210 [Ophiobolus disseminans]|uniref:Uncharacterized protein n=1 Tax=Ophiobolus disseminans TaxID=1469910 RepID=A0A6A6ZEI1_9PLEO|nr:hypothetical protein CC86DRAFT_388210 [Ophiobolus disseminans]
MSPSIPKTEPPTHPRHLPSFIITTHTNTSLPTHTTRHSTHDFESTAIRALQSLLNATLQLHPEWTCTAPKTNTLIPLENTNDVRVRSYTFREKGAWKQVMSLEREGWRDRQGALKGGRSEVKSKTGVRWDDGVRERFRREVRKAVEEGGGEGDEGRDGEGDVRMGM